MSKLYFIKEPEEIGNLLITVGEETVASTGNTVKGYSFMQSTTGNSTDYIDCGSISNSNININNEISTQIVGLYENYNSSGTLLNTIMYLIIPSSSKNNFTSPSTVTITSGTNNIILYFGSIEVIGDNNIASFFSTSSTKQLFTTVNEEVSINFKFSLKEPV